MLPAHLDRTLHAVCGRLSEADDGESLSATIADIEARMADPPSRPTLKRWLRDVESRGLIERAGTGWRVTEEGWRAVNLMQSPDPAHT
jgi:hypothetical protein